MLRVAYAAPAQIAGNAQRAWAACQIPITWAHIQPGYWCVSAREDDFTGFVLDYGALPDQKRGFFTLQAATKTLYKGLGIRAGRKRAQTATQTIHPAGFKEIAHEPNDPPTRFRPPTTAPWNAAIAAASTAG